MSKLVKKNRQYIKRFGAIAIERGYITLEQLIEALSIQVIGEIDNGSHRLVGSILFEQDILTGSQLQEIVDAVLSHKTD